MSRAAARRVELPSHALWALARRTYPDITRSADPEPKAYKKLAAVATQP